MPTIASLTSLGPLRLVVGRQRGRYLVCWRLLLHVRGEVVGRRRRERGRRA